ncbi:hypothetical protein Pcinc_027475 [Petrolisthes cinctipes]|uniref:Uncharacterized protein n=1 Tax=Petrolisthes cinctipes TaxID=88211 RepID=A0AAE1KAR6_PETCI|nr:hypothetical protein Pcinc_027475 [Petrolisthes cinctipes]
MHLNTSLIHTHAPQHLSSTPVHPDTSLIHTHASQPISHPHPSTPTNISSTPMHLNQSLIYTQAPQPFSHPHPDSSLIYTPTPFSHTATSITPTHPPQYIQLPHTHFEQNSVDSGDKRKVSVMGWDGMGWDGCYGRIV